MNQADFAREIRATSADITNWKSRGLPPARFRVVAERLGITVDELLKADPLSPVFVARELSVEEAALIDDYRAATMQGRAAASAVLKAVAQPAKTGTGG
jgi:hypothetical protein